MPAHDPIERSLIAQTAAHRSWQKTKDRTARTAAGRAAYKAKREALRQQFLAEVDGDQVAVENAIKAHEAKVKLAAVRARRRVVEAAEAAAVAEEELRSLGLVTE